MNEITMMFVICLAVAFVLYMQITKMTQNIDKNEALKDQILESKRQNLAVISEEQTQKYKEFCDEIDAQIRTLRQMANDGFLNDESLKDEFLAELSQYSRKLTFIQNMNIKKDATTWESELFEILNGIENSVLHSLKNGEKINYDMRENLRQSFLKVKS